MPVAVPIAMGLLLAVTAAACCISVLHERKFSISRVLLLGRAIKPPAIHGFVSGLRLYKGITFWSVTKRVSCTVYASG